MGLPRVKKAGDSSYERRKYDKHQRRLLSNELRDLDAIKTRQVNLIVSMAIDSLIEQR